MSDGDYELVLTPLAAQTVRSGPPKDVAVTVIEFLIGTLVENPQRVGKQLRVSLAAPLPLAEAPIECCTGVMR